MNSTGQSQVDYVCELKLDGMSLALRFADGKLALGLTRGDGTTGEDVTPNVRTVRSVPLTIADKTLDKAGLPRDFEVRGELLMPLKSFERMNEEREAARAAGVCQSAQRDRRNGAHAGAQRHRAAAARLLRLRPVGRGKAIFDRHSQVLKALQAAGFKVNPRHKLAHDLDQMMEFINETEAIRDSLPYEIDGVVMKVDRVAPAGRAGLTPAKHRAGPLPTSSRRARARRRSKTSWCRWDAQAS